MSSAEEPRLKLHTNVEAMIKFADEMMLHALVSLFTCGTSVTVLMSMLGIAHVHAAHLSTSRLPQLKTLDILILVTCKHAYPS